MYQMKRSATLTLITIICGAYLLQMLDPTIQTKLALISDPFYGYGVSNGEWYRLFTVALTHGGLTHLAFNMFSLLVLGNPLEAAFGKVRFLVIFFVSLLTGSLASLYFSQGMVYSVGASGAIFGLFGSLMIVGKRIGANVKEIGIIIGFNFALGFIFGGVDWKAHLGGLVGGAATTFVLLRITRL
jgi:rhomboid protease GluP